MKIKKSFCLAITCVAAMCWTSCSAESEVTDQYEASLQKIESRAVQTSPIGYGRNATGGAGGSVVTVSSVSALKNALKASGPSIIIVTKNITFGEGDIIKVEATNKTLLGLKGVKLKSTARVTNGGILQLSSGSNNVIIRNLIFEGPGAYDVDGNDLLQNVGCTNLWVDHCEFYDGVDGNFDNTKKADNVTISYCKFGYKIAPLAGGSGGTDDHRFTNVVGSSSSDCPSDGQFSITFQCCYWSDGCKERMPRARNAQLHILNCYYNTSTSKSLALGLEGGTEGTTCYVEGTNFKKITQVYKSYGTGTQNLTFVNCLNGAANIGSVVRPSYSYTALNVNDVENEVESNAGATLTVSLDGKVS